MSRGASRAGPWAAAAAAAAFVARGLRGAAEPGGDLECLGRGQGAQGPSLCPWPHPSWQVVRGGPRQHPPASAPAPPFVRTGGARTSCRRTSLASAVKGSLTLISSCMAGLGPQRGLLFLSW